MAEQIAHLLNQFNKLQSPYTGDKIIKSKAKYRPIQYEGLVFGSVATLRMSFMLTEIKHLVVHKAFRNAGLGKKLIENAMEVIDTPVMYATIRSKNTASLRLFEAAGFEIKSTAKFKDHDTHFLMKDNEAHIKINPISKTKSTRETFPSLSFGSTK